MKSSLCRQFHLDFFKASVWGQKEDKVNLIFMFLRDRDRALLASAG